MAGVDIDVLDHAGRSALHDSTERGSFRSTLILLAAGADVTAGDRLGRTACRFAANHMVHMPATDSLHAVLAGGGDFDAPDNDDITPRHIASRHRVSAPSAEDLATDCCHATRTSPQPRAPDLHWSSIASLDLDALQICEILVHACGLAAS